MMRTILILTISFLSLISNTDLFGQQDTSTKSIRRINIDEPSYNALLSHLQLNGDSSFVIIGEAHDVNNTYLTEFFIIKHLSGLGYRHLYIEGGESEAAILNLYLQTGNELLLQNTRAQDSTDYKEFISLIYILSKEKKIGFVFHGYDFERLPCLVFLFGKWFAQVRSENILLTKRVQQLLSLNYEMEKASDKVLNDSIITVIDSVKSDFTLLEKEYQNILKENFPAFKAIIFNPIIDHVFSSDRSKFKRDKFITETMLANEKSTGLKKGIMIIGSDHLIREKKFAALFLDKLKTEYSFTFFLNVYKNCGTSFFGKIYKYNSDKKLFHYVKNKYPKEPVITFSLANDKIIPSRRNFSTVLVEFYDQ